MQDIPKLTPFKCLNSTPEPLLLNYQKEIQDLLGRLDLPIGSNSYQINDILQTHMLRPAGKERYQLDDKHAKNPLLKDKILSQLKKIWMVDKFICHNLKYDAILIHGILPKHLRQRLLLLDYLWREGVYAPEIVFLTSEKCVDVHQQTQELIELGLDIPRRIPNAPKDVFKLIWAQVLTSPELKKQSVNVICVPDKNYPETGQTCRPNTRDTIDAWINTLSYEKPLRCLAVSNNPFVGYQHMTAVGQFIKKGLFHKGYTLETVGAAADITLSTEVYLDSLARWWYTEYGMFNTLSAMDE